MIDHKKVYVAKTINGMGLFARRNIKKGETLFVIKGTLIKDDYNDDFESIPNAVALSEGRWLNPHEDNPWRYINHSCNPNAGLKGSVTVVAMKKIRGGGR